MSLKTITIVIIVVGIITARGDDPPSDNNSTLELLQVVVRHGNRTSFSAFTQWIPEYVKAFERFAFGSLTPRGRQQMEDFGKFLRNRYNDFLPDEFSYLAVSVNCSDSPRVVESAMVAMAAMFPPKNVQKWGDSRLGQIWTPISCRSVPASQDYVLSPMDVDCPAWDQLQTKVQTSPEYMARYNELTGNGSVMEYIQRSLNMSTSEPLSADNLENVKENFHAMSFSGLQLPEWSKAVYPHPLNDIDHLAFQIIYASPKILMFSVGEYLREILSVAQALENKTLRPLQMKLYISFAHDLTIMPLLKALNLEENPQQPDYGGAMIMEMHRIPETQEIGFRFVYRNVTWQEPTIFTVPGCKEICPLWFIRQQVQQYISPIPFTELCSQDSD